MRTFIALLFAACLVGCGDSTPPQVPEPPPPEPKTQTKKGADGKEEIVTSVPDGQ